MSASRKPQKWAIAKLKPHPRQAEAFGDVSEVELDELKSSIAREGLRVPPEILPDGTILTGHQRVRAARALGWSTMDVVVRADLAAEGEAASERLFLSDNLTRRHLSPLGRARCIRRLLELEEGQTVAEFGFVARDALKERLGKRLDLSPRSVSRYLLVLTAVPGIQELFDKEKITLVVAGRLALRSKDDQLVIAERIGNGERPAEVLAEVLGGGTGRADDPGNALTRLLCSVHRETPHLTDQAIKALDQAKLSRSASILTGARDLFSALVAAAGQGASSRRTRRAQ